MTKPSRIHEMLDVAYTREELETLLDAGTDVDLVCPVTGETPLHVAVRRFRPEAVRILLDRGAAVDHPGRHGKTAWAHAVRRGFTEPADLLAAHGASRELTAADRLAVALTEGRLDDARAVLRADPSCVRTGNPEEDRVLADLAGREDPCPVRLLVEAGADLAAPGLDGGTPLHQAAWFGQPGNARILVDRGAPLDVFDPVHESSPLHWAAHGSRWSGGAGERQGRYVALVCLLLEAGSSVRYPPGLEAPRSYAARLLADASPAVAQELRRLGVSP